MSAGSIDYDAFDIKRPRSSGSVLIHRPEQRMMWIRYLAPVLILSAGVIIYLLPVGDLKIVFLPFTWLFLMAIAYSVIMHEILARAVYTVTVEYIESESGIVGRRSGRFRSVMYGTSGTARTLSRRCLMFLTSQCRRPTATR
jgi:hypothetical protein